MRRTLLRQIRKPGVPDDLLLGASQALVPKSVVELTRDDLRLVLQIRTDPTKALWSG